MRPSKPKRIHHECWVATRRRWEATHAQTGRSFPRPSHDPWTVDICHWWGVHYVFNISCLTENLLELIVSVHLYPILYDLVHNDYRRKVRFGITLGNYKNLISSLLSCGMRVWYSQWLQRVFIHWVETIGSINQWSHWVFPTSLHLQLFISPCLYHVHTSWWAPTS